MSDERRQFLRLDLRFNVSYTILGTPRRLGASVTRNLGASGVRFLAEHPLKPGMQLQLVLQLPDRQEPLTFTGEVVWSRARPSGDSALPAGISEVGVRFMEIHSKDRELIMQYAQLYGPPPTGEADADG